MTRVAVVTGAARGIGAATVAALVADGWQVTAVDCAQDDPRLPYRLGSAAELAQLGGPSVSTAVADVTDAGRIAEVIAQTESEQGGVDAVIAVAGAIAGGVPLWEMPEDQIDAVVDINLRGVVATARVGIPALLRRSEPRDGRFIAVGSAAARRGIPQLAVYGAAKAGVVGLVRGLAAELGGTGVTANCVSPGSTRTPMLDESARIYGLESVDAFADHQLIRRLLDPQEVAAAIAWLAGPAGASMTGADIPVDGGLTT